MKGKESMDRDTIMVGLIVFVVMLIQIYISIEKSKFIHIMNHPEMIQEMEKVPLWLKIRVWSQYGRYVGNHITEKELENREYCVYVNWILDTMRYGVEYNEEMQEFTESLMYTYRIIWIKILSSKNS